MEPDGFLPDLIGNVRNRREAVFERVKVKACAADHNGKAAGLCGGGDLRDGEGPPSRDGATLAGVEKAVEPVRHPPLGGLAGTCRQYAEIEIALQAVGIDDDAAQNVRQFERERRLPACRRTGDDENRRRAAAPRASRLVTGSTAGVGPGSMNMVLTLIAGAHGAAGLPGLVAAVADAVGIPAEPVWLAPGEACDLVFDALGAAAVEEAARALIKNGNIDVLVQPLAERRKRLLVADMESTIIENEMLDELADFLGLRSQISEFTRRAMNGEIDFVAALEARVALLAGMEHHVLEAAVARIRLTPGARALIATMRAAGAVTALVSGGFTIFAEQVAKGLGFDRVVANRLDITDGRVVGTVRHPIVTGETKRQTLLALAAEQCIPLERTMAVGDGANDLPMLATAGIGIAFRAKPVVASTARWRIDNADLTGLLYAQGYRSDEIIR
jgi:phosphoserine phosphatase